MDPLVSILSPSFQQARFLPDCLTSVAAQTYERIEHIVADGGSTDGSRELLAAAEPRVDWRSEPDAGQADAVNEAFKRSSGEFIGWINSDDALFARNTIASVVEYFSRHPSVSVVTGDAAIVDASGTILRHFRPRLPWGSRLSPVASPISQPATFLRRSAIEAVGGLVRPEFHLALDLELWLRLRAKGVRFAALPFVLAADRDHPDRKVRVLQGTEAADEYPLLAEMYGVRFEFHQRDRIEYWTRRWAGVRDVATWERRYAPAFGWRVDGLGARLSRQLGSTDAGAKLRSSLHDV